MSVRLRRAARAIRVLYGAVPPRRGEQPPPSLREPTHEEQMDEFEKAQRNSPGYRARLRAGHAAERALFGRRK